MPTQLNHHQTYLVEEFAEDYLENRLPRREMVKRVLAVTGSVPLTASLLFTLGCSGGSSESQPSTSSSGAAAPTTAPAAVPTPVGPGIPENDPAITAAAVRFPGPASEILAYMARPKDRTGVAGVLLIHENRGLTDHQRDIARRYAREGFACVCVDGLSRLGGTGPDANANASSFGTVTRNPADYTADLLAGVAYLKSQNFVKQGAYGVSGHCAGGTFTWEVAAASPDIKAAVPYYGSASPEAQAKFGDMKAAVLAIYAGNDARITGQEPELMAKLKAAGKTAESKVYPNTEHGFFNETGTRYNKEASEDAWKLTLAHFRKHLV